MISLAFLRLILFLFKFKNNYKTKKTCLDLLQKIETIVLSYTLDYLVIKAK